MTETDKPSPADSNRSDAEPAAAPEEPVTDPEALMRQAADRIAALEAEAADLRDKWLRAEAETQNVRARARREVEDARAYAVTKFARDAAEVAENLERALAALPAPEPDEAPVLAKVREGIGAIERAFLAALERNGVARQEAAGQPFNPDLHQAMMEQESAEAAPGTVLAAWSPAWTLNGRLLKPAMVVVAKAPAGSGAPSPPAPAAPQPANDPGPPAGGKLDTTA